jgi:TRAP-type C4-dicarboxylate transport system permease small subunit
LWLRAQLSERQAAAERAQKILQWVEIACVTAACAGLGMWLAWSWNEIGGEIAGALGWALFDAWPALWGNLSGYGPSNAPLLFSLALALISVVALGVAYPLLMRE